MLLISLFFSLITAWNPEPRFIKDDPLPETVNKAVLLRLVNDVRKKGCSCGKNYYSPAQPLTWSEQLEKAALKHSNDMFQKKYFSHTGSDGSGSGDRISRVGYKWKFYGENIAHGYRTEKEVIAGWLSSPGHCRNIMNKFFTEMGVAKMGTYWTQDFGRK